MSEAPRTRAERTAYAETSHYDDVIAFLEALAERSPLLHLESLATSVEGRSIPLAVVSDPPVSTPEAARGLDRPVAFVMANIHAGEVEGKEASLHLLRRLLLEDLKPLLERIVVLVAPIYNADGNEQWGPQVDHRPGQNGPERVGVRPNAQGLDLNRDYMKLESPEARGLVENVFLRWDPHLVVDCHATNGSHHGYALTWAPPLNPNARPGPIAFTQEHILAPVAAQLEAQGIRTFPYGNYVDPEDPGKGWRTFDHRPRFGNSYVGLRNRLCVLSEAYSYDDFETRVRSTEAFVRELLEAFAGRGEAARAVCAEADRQASRRASSDGAGARMGVAFELAPPHTREVLVRERKLGPADVVPMPVFDAFRAVRTVPLPHGYVLEPALVGTADLLRRHGVRVETLDRSRAVEAEGVRLLEVRRAEKSFQGHRQIALETERSLRRVTLPAGALVVPLNQPLADLAAYLCEPESDDGAATWNLFDRVLETLTPGRADAWLPVHRLLGPV
ncbi:MAG: M14 family metallopeptidase [Planctomycetota bacterium]|jgi:hypothetical protein